MWDYFKSTKRNFKEFLESDRKMPLMGMMIAGSILFYVVVAIVIIVVSVITH
jgi:flagellar biosynthesis/type III secretory pathway M-ring protein FliF/YscJ